MKQRIHTSRYVLLITLSFCLQLNAQNDFPFELLSNELIWYTEEFRGERVGGIRSMADGKHYTSLERGANGSAIVKYEYRTGEPVDTLATSLSVFGNADQSFRGYDFSADESRIMISTSIEPLYRHSYYADFYVYNLNSKSTVAISDFAEGKQRLATFSPSAGHVAFMRDNNVFVVDLETMKETQVTTDGEINGIINGATDWVYEEEFGDDNGLFWSPSGRYLAFMRFDETDVKEFGMPMYGDLYPDPYVFKYPKAGEQNATVQVKVFDVEQQQTVSATVPDAEYIPRVKWGQNDAQLLVFTMNRHQNELTIHLGDCTQSTATVETEPVWTETSSTYLDITDDMTFLSDGKSFLMTSKRDEFNHIYQFSLDPKQEPVQLTSGKWDVIGMQGFDEKRKEIYFTCSKEGATQTHLARVNLKAEMELLHSERGTHSAAYSNSFDYYIHTYHNANTPPVYTLRNKSGKTVRELKDNQRLRTTLAKYNMQPKEFFSFNNDAGVELNAWMIKPPGFNPNQEYPVYVSIYGGPGVNTVTDSWGGENYYWHQLLAQQGYIVASVDPRGTPKRGRKFEHSTYKELGKLETEDFIDFGEYLGNQSYVDADRIGIQGWSYGGFMTLLCMTKGADVYKAGISVAPVTNWRYYDTIYTERFMQTPAENAGGYDDNSPVNHAEKLKGSLLLVHGSADDNVHFQNSMEMVDALVGAGKDFDFFAYPNRNHGIYGGNTRLHLFDMMLDFVHDNL
ncbi:MAG: S9 family peptidase [Flavobacteriales bacterium]